MANEISLSGTLKVTKTGSPALSVSSGSFLATLTGKYTIDYVMALTTSAANIDKGAITTPGWAMFQNLGAVNAEIGHDVSAAFQSDIVVPAGKWVGPVYLKQATPQALCASSTCDLRVVMVEA